MLTKTEKEQLQGVLDTARKRLAKVGQNALNYSMNHERNIGRDSIDESMEEELFSTEMRLHDREKYLLVKVDKQVLLPARQGGQAAGASQGRHHRRVRKLRGKDRVQASFGPAGHHVVH